MALPIGELPIAETGRARSGAEAGGQVRPRLRRGDFVRITRRGRRVSTRYFIVFLLERAGGSPAEESGTGVRDARRIGPDGLKRAEASAACGAPAAGGIDAPSLRAAHAGGAGADGFARARLGLTVTRKIGNAVRRNRIKRLVREWFRSRRDALGALDVVVIAKRDLPARLTQSDVMFDLERELGGRLPRPGRVEQ